MALPKKKDFIQEVVEPTPATQPEFLQEVIEPEVHIPEEPEVLFEESEEMNVSSEDDRVVIKPGRSE
jgi:hypothetical protein